MGLFKAKSSSHLAFCINCGTKVMGKFCHSCGHAFTPEDALIARATPAPQVVPPSYQRPNLGATYAVKHSKHTPSEQGDVCFSCQTPFKTFLGFYRNARWCEFSGRYFCHTCHTGRETITPAHVIREWDFSSYPVSNLAKDTLLEIADDPIFDLSEINPLLYVQVPPLKQVKLLRMQLFSLYEFIVSCRLAHSLPVLTGRGTYLATDPDLYSLKVTPGDLRTWLASPSSLIS